MSKVDAPNQSRRRAPALKRYGPGDFVVEVNANDPDRHPNLARLAEILSEMAEENRRLDAAAQAKEEMIWAS